MNNLLDEETKKIEGGALKDLTGALLNAFTSLWKAIYSFGQGAGGAIRRIASGKVCKL